MICLNKSLPLVQEALSYIPSEPAVAKILASLPPTATIDDVLIRYNEMLKEKEAFKYNDTFFNTKTGEEFSNEMKDRLLKFLDGLNIRVEFNADEILNSREFKRNPLAAFDVLQKFMAFAAGQEKLLPREVAAAAYTFLGRKTTLSKGLWKHIKKWEDYDKWYRVYNSFNDPDADIFYEDDEYMEDTSFNPFAHKMVIIRFLEESIVKVASGQKPTEKNLNEDIDKTYFEKRGRLNTYTGTELEKAFKRVYNFLIGLFSQPLFKTYNRQQLADLGLDIAEDVLRADFNKFIRNIKEEDGVLYGPKGDRLELKTYNDTLSQDPVAKNLIKTLIDNMYIGFKLSGSLTLRRYGTLFRDVKENLHDIDGVIPLDVFKKDPKYREFVRWIEQRGLPLMREGRQKQFQKEVTPKLLQLNWYQNVLQEFPQFELTNAFIGKDHKRGESVTIQGEIKIGDATYKMDFFLRTREGSYPEIFDNYWKDWKQIFEAKLNMGRSKDISDLVYFSPFVEDKYKFTNKGFRYFVFAEDQTMAQREDIEMSKADEKTLEKVNQVLKAMGVNIQDLAAYAKEQNMDVEGVSGIADLARKIIAVAKGREGVVLTEEMVHIARTMLEQTNPGLVTEMISRIDQYKIYQRVLEVYGDDPRYLLPDGRKNIRKLKMEAVDKLIAEVIIKQSQGSTLYPELMEKEARNTPKTWWQKTMDWLGMRYDKAGIDIFEEAAARILRVGQVRDGVQELFKSRPELAAIGTPEQYSAYLDSLFPDSTSKGFYKHFTYKQNVDKILNEGFDVTKPPIFGVGSFELEKSEDKLGRGIVYFTADMQRWAKTYNRVEEGKGTSDFMYYDYDKQQWVTIEKGQVTVKLDSVNAIVNTSNFLVLDSAEKFYSVQKELLGTTYLKGVLDNIIEKAREQGYAGVIIDNTKPDNWLYEDRFGKQINIYKDATGDSGRKDLFVIDQSQTRLLGSPEDLQGFTNFVNNLTSPTISADQLEGGLFLQRHTLSTAQKRMNDLLNDTEKKITRQYEKQETDSVLVDSEEANNFYQNQEKNVRVKNRVTDRVKAWYRRVFGDKEFSEFQKKLNELKRMYGVDGHSDLMNIIRRYYNADGTRKDVPDDFNPDDVVLPSVEMYQKLEIYFLDLVDSINNRLEQGEVAVWAEKIIYDPVADEAGTIDLLIVEPEGRGHILDWKFMQVQSDNDVPWFKQEAFNTQLTRYQDILSTYYNVTSFGKVRAIPILMDFALIDPKDYESERYLSSIAIGSVNPDMMEDLRLVPVSAETESTGFEEFDSLIKALNDLAKQIAKEGVPEEEREYKIERLNLLRKAMRHLHGTQNVKPLIDAITVIGAESHSILQRLQQYIDTPPSAEDINNQDLSDISADARNFIDVSGLFERIDDEIGPLVYTENMEAEATTEEEKAMLKERESLLIQLKAAASQMRTYRNKIQKASREFADIHVGERNAVTGLESPEAVIKGLAASLRGASEIDSSALKILVRLVQEQEVKAQSEALELIKTLMGILNKIRQKHGDVKEYMKVVFQYTENQEFMNKLIRQFDKDFYSTVDELINNSSENNRKWMEENIDMPAFRKELDAALEKRLNKIEENPLYQINETDLDEKIDKAQRNKQIFAKEQLKKEAIEAARRKYDYDYEEFNGWNSYIVKRHPLAKWYTKEYKDLINNPRNAEALEFYNFMRELNKEAKDVNYISAIVEKVFMPFVRRDIAEGFKLDAGLSSIGNFFKKMQARADDVGFGKINEVTGELEMALPRYFTVDFTKKDGGPNDYTDVSEEVFKNTILYIQSIKRYKYMSEIEDQLLLVKAVEEFKKHYETTKTGEVIFDNNKPVSRKGNKNNADMFDLFLKGIFYGQKYAATDTDESIPVKQAKEFFLAAKAAILGKKYEPKEEDKTTYTSATKVLDQANLLTSMTLLGLDVTSGLANLFGTNIQLLAQKSDYFDYSEVLKNAVTLRQHLYSEGKGDQVFFQLLETFMPLSEDPSLQYYKEAGLTAATRRRFADDLFVFMRKPELLMEKAIFKTLLQNSMVVDGKIVNIQQYVKNKYKKQMYSEVGGVRKYKDIIKNEIEELKKKSIENTAKIDADGKLVVEGLDLTNKKETKRLTLLARRIANRASGKSSATNKSKAEMHILFNSFLLLKRWAAPLLFTRFEKLQLLNDDFSVSIEEGEVTGEMYDIGRSRLYLYVLFTSMRDRSTNIINILRGNEKGMAVLDELYETYKKDYKASTGRDLNMSPEDFKHLVTTNLQNQTKELRLLLGMFLLLYSSGFFAPDDDEDRATKNRFRFVQKILKKFYDEISFFYRPGEVLGLATSGMASITVLDNFITFIDHLSMEVTGFDISNPELSPEKVVKKAKPIKYLVKAVPGGRSIMNWAASFSDDFAKDFDITIQKNSKR